MGKIDIPFCVKQERNGEIIHSILCNADRKGQFLDIPLGLLQAANENF